MKQVRLIRCNDHELAEAETELNAWIRDNQINVISITGNIAAQTLSPQVKNSGLAVGDSKRYQPSDILLIVTYEAGA